MLALAANRKGEKVSQFQPFLDYVLTWEDPERLYAATKDNNGAGVISGVNQAAFPSQFALINSIFQPQRGPAISNFYQSEFWVPLQLGSIFSQDLANRVGDMAVNAGPGAGVKLLQATVNDLRAEMVLVEDGAMGPRTLTAVNALPEDAALVAYRQQRANYYREVAARKPQYAADLPGWLRRAGA